MRVGLGTLLAVAPLLAACTAGTAPSRPGTVTPARAVLYEHTLTVEMSDRTFCTGPRGRQGRAWSGTLAGCPHLWPYSAWLPPHRTARLPLAPVEGGAGRAELTSPAGRVFVLTGG
jgi:hypothetical protein